MQKPLAEMSLDELWRLFPIVLTEHNPCWAEWFSDARTALEKILPRGSAVAIRHIGSTAVAGILAKPTVDILLETPSTRTFPAVCRALCDAGYLCMSKNALHISFNKGYTQNGYAERVFHLHLRVFGDHDELYFRDYLIDHPETADAYAQMKKALWRQYTHDRDGYTQSKTEFIEKITARAKILYAGRYSAPPGFSEETSVQTHSNAHQ